MVAFDNTILSLLIFPNAEASIRIRGSRFRYARERELGLVTLSSFERAAVIVGPAGYG